MATVLIDADITAFQVCSNMEVETEWENDVWTLHSNLRDVQLHFDEAIENIMDVTGASDCILAFTGKRNFRKEILPDYKGHRTGRKPMNYGNLKDYARTQYKCDERDGLEGDDVLGILATSNPDTFIFSADKDMLTIPGNLWNSDVSTVVAQSREVADWYFMKQTLTGDATDGYKGCPGVGPVKAAKLLGEPGARDLEEMWEVVVAAYMKAGLTEDDALVQARCARILRNTDINKQGPILWTPPTT